MAAVNNNVKYMYSATGLDGAGQQVIQFHTVPQLGDFRYKNVITANANDQNVIATTPVQITQAKLPSELVLVEVNNLMTTVPANNTPAVKILRTILESNLLTVGNKDQFNRAMDAIGEAADATAAARAVTNTVGAGAILTPGETQVNTMIAAIIVAGAAAAAANAAALADAADEAAVLIIHILNIAARVASDQAAGAAGAAVAQAVAQAVALEQAADPAIINAGDFITNAVDEAVLLPANAVEIRGGFSMKSLSRGLFRSKKSKRRFAKRSFRKSFRKYKRRSSRRR
jgi:hypothetical protein